MEGELSAVNLEKKIDKRFNEVQEDQHLLLS